MPQRAEQKGNKKAETGRERQVSADLTIQEDVAES